MKMEDIVNSNQRQNIAFSSKISLVQSSRASSVSEFTMSVHPSKFIVSTDHILHP